MKKQNLINSRNLLARGIVLWSLLTSFFLFSIPSQFVGYRQWLAADPEIKVSTKDKTDIETISIELSCPGADYFQISSYSDFRGAKWQKIAEPLTWQLPTSENIAVIYIVFKRENKIKKIFEISSIFTYAIDKKDASKKIEKIDSGFIDWTEGKIIITSLSQSLSNEQYLKRYEIIEAQSKAQKQLIKKNYNEIKKLIIKKELKIENFLDLEPYFYRYLNKTIKQLPITDISYPSTYKAQVSSQLYFFELEEKLSLIELVQRYEPFPIIEIGDNIERNFKRLILDARGFDFDLSVYPSIQTERGAEIISPTLSQRKRKNYVTYVRLFDEMKKDDLFLSVLSLSDDNALVLSDRSKTLIQANPKTLASICNGNLFIIVD